MNVREIISRYKTISSGCERGLKNICDKIWKTLTFNLIEGVLLPKKCLAVSLEKGSVSVAYGVRFLSRPRIKGFKRYYFDEGKYAGPENLITAVSLAMDKLKASGAEIVLSIPQEFLVVRTAELPVVVKENITSVMSYELDRLTPFTSAESMYDFKIYDEEMGQLKVIIAAARTDVLKPYLDALREKHIHTTRITVSAASLGTLCSAFDKGNDALCVSINEEGYEGCLMKRGIVASTFYGTFSGNDRDENLGSVAEALAPFLVRLRSESASPEVFLFPVEGYTMLEQRLGIPVRILKKEDIQSKFKTVNGEIIFTPLGGLLEEIWPKAKGFNLVHKGVRAVKKTPMVITIILCSIILAMMIPYLVVPFEMEKRRLREIDAQIVSRKGEIKKIEALKKEINALSGEIGQIKDFKESRPMALNVMKELTTILPKTVWLTRTRITEETVEIEGYANAATEILTKLEQSNLFKKVEFTSPTIRDAKMNLDRFVIKMEIEGFEKKQAGGEKNEKIE
jgi:Tfp pilus assembly protein PilN